MIDIQSLRDTVHANYIRPDPGKVTEYETNLEQNQEAQRYLTEERKLSMDTARHFHLGYRSDYDAISIPIYKNGLVINIKYRFLHPRDAKYGGERGAETWIYNETGVGYAKTYGKLLVVEGEFDAMAAFQAGVKNVVSPASGKDSFGPWIELIDQIKEVFIAYDNDSGGRESAAALAQRAGIEKCFEVKYPEGIKDASDFLKANSADEFKALLKLAKPFHNREFKGIADVISSLRNRSDDILRTPFIPKVEIERDWLMVFSGRSNVGKTSYVLNIADDFTKKQIPTLVMPFERGIESVGRRFLQIKFNKTLDDFKNATDKDWDDMTLDCLETPVYFSMPKTEDVVEAIKKASRLFGVKVVIVDHLDYLIRASQHKEQEIGNTLQALKRVAEDLKVVIMIVTHVRKIDQAGSLLKKKPGIEDLKGSASLYQDPECVVMLQGDGQSHIQVEVAKNKGEMSSQNFPFDEATGRLSDEWGGM